MLMWSFTHLGEGCIAWISSPFLLDNTSMRVGWMMMLAVMAFCLN